MQGNTLKTKTDRVTEGSCGLNAFALAPGATAHTCRYQHCAPTLHHITHLSLPALCPNTAPQHTPVATSTVPQHCTTAHTCRYQHCAPTLHHSTHLSLPAHTCRYQHCAPTLQHSTHLSLPVLCPNTANSCCTEVSKRTSLSSVAGKFRLHSAQNITIFRLYFGYIVYILPARSLYSVYMVCILFCASISIHTVFFLSIFYVVYIEFLATICLHFALMCLYLVYIQSSIFYSHSMWILHTFCVHS